MNFKILAEKTHTPVLLRRDVSKNGEIVCIISFFDTDEDETLIEETIVFENTVSCNQFISSATDEFADKWINNHAY